MRLLCVDATLTETATDGGTSKGADGETAMASPIIHTADPRYFTSAAWAYAQRIDHCTPHVDRCPSDGAQDGTWRCSADLAGGLFRCPDGLDSLVFCPDGRACTQPLTAVAADADPFAKMCVSG